MELFEQTSLSTEPLASRMRPRNLKEYIGQDHIVGEGRLLRRAIQADRLTSVLFYGPPGTGKTTLARVIAGTTKSRFVTLNAVLSGVKEVREAIKEARDQKNLHQRKTILFVDEVHRWNKAQQDALLPWVENGTVILIGATTENPYFEVNSALVSRSRVFQLVGLTNQDLTDIAKQALSDKERGYGHFQVEMEEGALAHLVNTAAGDARSILGALELAVETSIPDFPPPKGEKIFIDLQTAEESIQKKVVLYDKEGDYHYDTISAFIKSLRGSDPDAALYWLARMVRAGEDPKFILRRMMISAAEDVGMADPNALNVITSVAQAFERVGLPEGQFFLSQGALYLATAPKSNSTMGYFDALRSIENELADEVPNHLKDPSRDKHAFGHGADYKYPHAYKDHWISQAYLPENLRGALFYKPGRQGYEGSIQEEVHRKREAALASMMVSKQEILTYSPGDRKKDKWLERANNGAARLLETIRKSLMDMAQISRHHRIYLPWESNGLFLWDSLRKVPEGRVYARIMNRENLQMLEGYSTTLEELDRPVLFYKEEDSSEFLAVQKEGFDIIIAKDPFSLKTNWDKNSKILDLLHTDGMILFSQIYPLEGQRLSSFLPPSPITEIYRILEQRYYNEETHPLFWKNESLEKFWKTNGFCIEERQQRILEEQRFLKEDQISRWFDESTGENTLGQFIKNNLDKVQWKELQNHLRDHLKDRQVTWESKHLFYKLKRK